MNIFLIVVQIIVLVVIGVVLWQIWQYLNRKDIPDDEVLGEKRAEYIIARLNVLKVCFAAAAVLSIIQLILRIMDATQG